MGTINPKVLAADLRDLLRILQVAPIRNTPKDICVKALIPVRFLVSLELAAGELEGDE